MKRNGRRDQEGTLLACRMSMMSISSHIEATLRSDISVPALLLMSQYRLRRDQLFWYSRSDDRQSSSAGYTNALASSGN